MALLLVAGCLCIAPGTLASSDSVRAQVLAPPTPAAAEFIVGRVIDAMTGQPIAGALVILQANQQTKGGRSQVAGVQPQPSPRLQADSAGRFVFRELRRGPVYISAEADGYLAGGYGQSGPGGLLGIYSVGLAEASMLTLKLWPEGVITGVVTDETGDPVPGVPVVLTPPEASADGPLRFSRYDLRYRANTDDRGAYRFGRLLPGAYLVSVPGRSPILPVRTAIAPNRPAPATDLAQTATLGYPTTFHPSSVGPDSAGLVEIVSGGHEMADVQLNPVAVVSVAGAITAPSGAPEKVALYLFPSYAVGKDIEFTHAAATANSRADGQFVFPAVPSGQYILRAWRIPVSLIIGSDPLPAEDTLWASVPVTVGAEPITNLRVPLEAGATLRGTIHFDGESPPEVADIGRMGLQPLLSDLFRPAWPLAMDRRLSVRVNSAGQFETQGVPPGRYVVNLAAGSAVLRGWHLESVTVKSERLLPSPLVVGTRDIAGIELTFTNRRTELAGTVLNRDGRPDAEAIVVLFPVDYHQWIAEGTLQSATRVVRTADDGSYAMRGLVAGAYYVAALPETAATTWPDANKIAVTAALSTSIVIRAGELKQQPLRRR